MKARRNLLRAALAALLIFAAVPVGVAVADPPSLTIESPSTGSSTNEQDPLFSGSTSDPLDPVTLGIYEGPSAVGIRVQTLTTPFAPVLGVWSLSPAPPLEQGTYTAVAEQTDALETGTSAPVTFTVDTTAPVVSLNPVATPSNDASPTLAGAAGELEGDGSSVTVTIYAGASVGGAVARLESVPVVDGEWSYATPSLADGTYTAQATQSDAAGNVGLSAPVTFTVDTTAPVVSLNPVATPSNDASPTLAGAAGELEGDGSSVTVTIYAGASVGGVVVSSETTPVLGGAWSYATSRLPDGTYTAQASQDDDAGNTGVSQPVTFTVDTTAPAVGLTAPAEGALLNDSTPTFRGPAGDEAEDGSSVTLNVYAGGSVSGSPVQTVQVARNGEEWKTKALQLPDGVYTAQATQSDAAGNTGTSSPHSFTIDTTPPAVTIAPVASPTDSPTPTLQGSAGTAVGDDTTVTVTVYRGSSVGGSVAASEEVAVAAGAWSLTVAHLSDGTYTAQAAQSDAAGNVGLSSSVTFTVDTKAPAVGLTTPADGAHLNVSKPTFSGPAGNEDGDGSVVTVTIYAGDSASGTPVQIVETARSGESWTTGSAGPQLPDGPYTVQATQSDAAGNTGTSSAHTFTIKTDTPKVTLNALPSVTSDDTPSFSGTADTGAQDLASVTLKIYRGTSATGTPVEEVTAAANGAAWVSGAVQALPDGTYTAQAEQADVVEHIGFSAAIMFRVDTTPPHITLTAPVNGSSSSAESQLVKGIAGTDEGDLPKITVQLFAGTSAEGQTPLEAIEVTASKGAWSVTFGGLSPGAYTVRAEQWDDAGNLGLSAASVFEVLEAASSTTTTTSSSSTVTATTPPNSTPRQPPVASFAWFPTDPHTGESVSLVSNSTDADSPIAGFAWGVAGDGAFAAGGSAITTTFATAGSHTVRLRVSDADGLSDEVAEKIDVTAPPLVLMQPFPIVRIAGMDTAFGAEISLLSVQAPVGARVTVRCHGRGCPARSMSRIASAHRRHGATSSALVEFPRFERSLRAGAILEIRVSRRGQIGKYTRFTIRHDKPPVRVDECLASIAAKPIVCPPS